MIGQTKHTIILVDDDDYIREIFKERFKRWYHVLTFTSASALLGVLDQMRAGLFVLDWMMPEMDGIALCREIRKRHQFDIVPIAFYTAIDPSIENIQSAFRAGAQSFISKGHSSAFTIAQITSLVESYERLASFLGQRETMLSVLKHDMASLATGLTTGVEVLAMHPAFEDSDLKAQADAILDAGKNLRVLFNDLNDVLVTDTGIESKDMHVTHAVEIFNDLREYLKNFLRSVTLRDAGMLTVKCDRHGLGRALYYAMKFLDQYLPVDVPVTVGAERQDQVTVFSLEVRGSLKDSLDAAIADVQDLQKLQARHDFMYIQYIQNVLYHHKATLMLAEDAGQTFLRFHFPNDTQALADQSEP